VYHRPSLQNQQENDDRKTNIFSGIQPVLKKRSNTGQLVIWSASPLAKNCKIIVQNNLNQTIVDESLDFFLEKGTPDCGNSSGLISELPKGFYTIKAYRVGRDSPIIQTVEIKRGRCTFARIDVFSITKTQRR